MHLSDQAVLEAIRAINRQVVEDFGPSWGAGCILGLHAASFDPTAPDSLEAEDDCRYLENKMAGAREQMTKRIDKIDDRIRKLDMKPQRAIGTNHTRK